MKSFKSHEIFDHYVMILDISRRKCHKIYDNCDELQFFTTTWSESLQPLSWNIYFCNKLAWKYERIVVKVCQKYSCHMKKRVSNGINNHKWICINFMRKTHLNLFDGRFISEVRPSVVARSALIGSVDNDLLQCVKTMSSSHPLFAASRAVFASVMTRLE